MNTQKEIIEDAVYMTLGIHPASVIDREGNKTVRGEYGDGWNSVAMQYCKEPIENPTPEQLRGINDCKDAIQKAFTLCNTWVDSLGVLKDKVLKLVDEENLFLMIRKGVVAPVVNCNDTFYYASADCEDITVEELPEYLELVEKNDTYGWLVWCCKKRQHRPLSPLVERMKLAGVWTTELEALKSPHEN